MYPTPAVSIDNPLKVATPFFDPEASVQGSATGVVDDRQCDRAVVGDNDIVRSVQHIDGYHWVKVFTGVNRGRVYHKSETDRRLRYLGEPRQLRNQQVCDRGAQARGEIVPGLRGKPLFPVVMSLKSDAGNWYSRGSVWLGAVQCPKADEGADPGRQWRPAQPTSGMPGWSLRSGNSRRCWPPRSTNCRRRHHCLGPRPWRRLAWCDRRGSCLPDR